MEKLSKPYLRRIRTVGDISVWSVDGAWVRRHLDIDFTNFGQHYRFKFIPRDEFWLDEEFEERKEADFFIRHLQVERRLMAKGLSYPRALSYAGRAERAERLKSARTAAFLRIDTDAGRLRRLHKRLLAAYGRGIKIWLIDGELVRGWHYLDFTQGGHDKVYPFVPAGEVWIDDDLTPAERPYVLLHELHERQLMAGGLKYPAAHRSACELEQRCRQRPSLLAGLIREALRLNAGAGEFRPAERARAILFELRAYADPRNVAGMARYGISTRKTLGVTVARLRQMAKELGRDHRLADRLWRSGIHEARILASLVDDPLQVTQTQADRWAADLDSWDVCDQVCSNLLEATPFACSLALRWSRDEREFVRRAGFTLMARLALPAKGIPDAKIRSFLPAIIRGAADERNFVKKAVSWALRQIGKRDSRLRAAALGAARRLLAGSSRPAKWIARDAIRELNNK